MPPIVAVSGIFFLRDVPKDDIIWLFKALYYITLIHALLYIIQCSTGLPVLEWQHRSMIESLIRLDITIILFT